MSIEADTMAARNLMCGLDIGGTLAKLVVFVPHETRIQEAIKETVKRGDFPKKSNPQVIKKFLQNTAWVENDLSLRVEGGSLLFLKFMSRKSNHAGKFVEHLGIIPKGTVIHATGGGSHKFEEGIERLGMQLVKHDEMECLVLGLRIMSTIRGECFRLKSVHFHGAIGPERNEINPVPLDLDIQEGFLVVNIGSGVSFVHCTEDSYERVGGSSLGGSTFLGLVALLTGVDQFDKAVDLATKGDSGQIDMLVRDIYGESTKALYGLRPTTLASSFGKGIDKKSRAKATKEDLALSTLMMISMNVAALAHLHAKAKNAKHIVFTGNFLARSGHKNKRASVKLGSSSELHLHKRNAIAMRTLAYATKFWSQGERTAVFFRHEGYLGSIGSISMGIGKLAMPAIDPTPKL